MMKDSAISFRFSGHETFACRYAWLPKAAQAVEARQDILLSANEDDAMVELGVGKNMVRSIRFWAEAADIIIPTKSGHNLTDFGRELLLGSENRAALDAYLEDIQTLWLIHWKLATNQRATIFVWDFLLNHFQEPYMYGSTVVRALAKAVSKVTDKEVTQGSLEQLFEVFLHSYVPTRGKKGEVREDNLDCPLAELNLLRQKGFAESAEGKNRLEQKYVFRREEKFEISNELFAFCLDEFWRGRYMTEATREKSIPFHTVVNGRGSPGQVFKISEADIRTRLLGIEKHTDGFFRFEESAAIPRVVRQNENERVLLLRDVYDEEVVCG